MSISGIHHVTAVSSRIGENLAFYTGVLGLRLVKKSVNQDDVSAYHLFYADEVGSPGTDLTFFDWPTIGGNQPGPGTVELTTFRAPGGSLEFWEQRLKEMGAPVERGEDGAGRSRILFADPEGQQLALVDGSGLPNESTPWDKVVPADKALRGLLGVEMESFRPDSTRRVLTEIMGFSEAAGSNGSRFAVHTDNSSAEIVVREPRGRHAGRVGAGGVHHVAFRVRDDEELKEYQDKLESAGYATSGYVNRFYFHSLYFREPGGVLFELATDGPGFASDESPEHLGEGLALPPFLEGKRAAIEAGLKPLPEPAYTERSL
jgi:glyoxalase family protein